MSFSVFPLLPEDLCELFRLESVPSGRFAGSGFTGMVRLTFLSLNELGQTCSMLCYMQPVEISTTITMVRE